MAYLDWDSTFANEPAEEKPKPLPYAWAEGEEVCMCGQSMLNHESPMDCGHTPVSMNEYYNRENPERKDKMNYSTAVFLIPDCPVRALKCAYELNDKDEPVRSYVFKTFDKSIEPGDIVVVPTNTRVKFTCVKVIEEDLDFDPDFSQDMKWIVSKVSQEDYSKVLKQEEDLIKTLKAGERAKRRKEMAERLGVGLDELKNSALVLEHKKS